MKKVLVLSLISLSCFTNASILGGLTDKPYSAETHDDWKQVYYIPNKRVTYLNPQIHGDVQINNIKAIVTPVMVVNTEPNRFGGNIKMFHRAFDCKANTFADIVIEEFKQVGNGVYNYHLMSNIEFKEANTESDYIVQSIVCEKEVML